LPDVVPFRVPGPVEMCCRFNPGPFLDALRTRAGQDFIADDTLRLRAETATAVWSHYWQLKLKAQADITREI